jgi:hypothetical protein
MTDMTEPTEKFSVRVTEATFIPDENAIREFVKQFIDEQEHNPALRERFELNPDVVLAERGLALDMQREGLISSGISGAEESCHVCTCCVTEWHFCEHSITLVMCKGTGTTITIPPG